MHVYLKNVAPLHFVKHTSMTDIAFALMDTLEILHQHAIQVRIWLVYFAIEICECHHFYSCTINCCPSNSWV